MSKGNHTGKNPTPKNLLHGMVSQPKETTGSKFVKKAGMTITYTNHNKKGVTDKQEWA